jgi:hypothetical protein
MKNLFDPFAVAEIKTRLGALRPESQRQWGSMALAQAIAHCSGGLEFALGDQNPPRVFIGRLVGWAIKPLALGNDQPLRKNSPTAKALIIQDQRDFQVERARLLSMIDRFVHGGHAACTRHPHAFFGPLTPDEWAILMYKHLDHHMRQFGG